MTHVAVVGGGISGVTAAYRLRAGLGDGATITVFESGESLGGKLRTVELAGQAYDVGAEAFLARRPEALALVEETGLGDRLTHPTKARSTIRAGGRQVAMPGGTMMGVPGSAEAVAGVLSEEGRRRVAAEPELPPVRLGDDVALGELLRGRFGDELVDRLVDPLLGGVYAGGADGLGLRATVPALASAIDKGAHSLTEAAASLIPTSTSGAPVFGTLTGGLGTLVDRLVELAKPDVRCNTLVRGLTRLPTGFRLELVDEAVDVDAVLLAVPAPAARRLLENVVPVAAAALNEVELASMAVVALALPPDAAVPDASGVLIGVREGLTAKAFTFSSRKWAHLNDGALLVRGSVGRFGEPGALRADDDELVRLVRADLAELTGVTAEPLDTYVMRWGGGLPQYGVGHLGVVARVERAVAEVPGLAIAGAALHGVGIPACIATATAAASRITSAPGSGREVPK
ncbi:protoporphyrinogen oxidase [Amycolatopsis acidiphila]|uniref:Coproporphyrinogen III oxidase n=1 Tax=Amycolatopsis acidiphila TaxID=715473 RepID=A0A557ZVW0_9PSEU|nr:protoporphyrinogen oxidase [Amycolatopsis acidiphila]TVT16163.1 protoporphyrinogen oxidase [Amycolatopsis acidiphila]UIJ58069.1 protoporphyrinogen oxidase [Amycolatopsis acidiphila]GHG70289.1 protoporphyrinogen oxidase [Amycolatopsis acidiphila]